MILETNRLIIRELNVGDAGYFYELNKDPLVIQYTGDVAFESEKAAKLFLEKYPANNYLKYNCGRWAVILKSTNEWLGWCGIKYMPAYKEYDIGYRFYRKYWGHGYATESALACLQYGFAELKLNEIVGHAMKENIASIKVLEKIGMEYVKDYLMDDKYPAVLFVKKI
ncbi:MAG: GNAT family N-acetyltransferase [Bacteroidota bacterium]